MKQQELAPRLGRAAQQLVAAWLLRNNDVWVATMPDPSSTDLVVIPRQHPHKRITVQVKSTFDAGKQHRSVNVARSSGRRYSPDEVDFVVAVDLESVTFWVLPLRSLGGKTRIRLGRKYSGYMLGWHDPCTSFGSWAKP